MANDIEKQIEEEAFSFAKKICKDMGVYGTRDYRCTSGASDYEAFKHGGYFVLEKRKESERWISVNDELPPEEEFGVSENVILKLEVYGAVTKNTYQCCIEAYYDLDLNNWHPMLPIDDKNLKITPIAWRPIQRL